MPDLHPTLIAATLFMAGATEAHAGAVVPREPPLARFALEILEPPERGHVVRDFPVAVGAVFPEGELRAAPGGRVVDDRGRAVPFEAEVTGWWSARHESVKWLLLRFNASTDRRYFFERGGEARHPEGAPLAVAEDGGIRVATGPLTARLSGSGSRLFDRVTLHGRPMLAVGEPAHVLVADDGTTATPCTLREGTLTLEESTPARAVVKASGTLYGAGERRVARLELRYQFFRGESFVRLYHTLTWLVKEPPFGARELALRLAPAGTGGRVRVGLAEYGNESLDLPATGRVLAYQEDAEHFRVTGGDRQEREGRRLGGWVAVEGADGRGVGVSLRDAWQTFPTAFSWEDGQLRIQFWPSAAPRMAFTYQDLMPADFYHNAAEWNRYLWIKDAGHFIHEYTSNPQFLHTPEGAARTHELTLHFYDRDTRRTAAELNGLTQHPLVVRQEPRAALRVPFMGFDLTPADPARYPDIERAIAQLGRMVTARWSAIHDYGLWRYGMIRWATPGGALYRWFDGLQYDLQLIPWLLYMRGGDRRFFEEGEATARWAMDVATNHFNTRGAPTGYQTPSAGMPFPWYPHHMQKAMKIHFLAYYYHLTGYRRAREVMEECIAGARQEALADPNVNPATRRGWARELFNMNVFWVNAYEETGDPALLTLAREWADRSATREFDAGKGLFRAPEIYLYNGLILQAQLGTDARLRDVMLQNLALMGYPTLPDGGLYDVEKAIACPWAYQQTGDARYIAIGWDVARTLADLVPDHDWSRPEVPRYPISGNQFYRHLMMPLLVNASLAARHHLPPDAPYVRRDTYVSLDAEARGEATGQIFLRPRRDGDLTVHLSLVSRMREPLPAVAVAALDSQGTRLAATTLGPGTPPAADDRFPSPRSAFLSGTLTLPNARAGATYTLRLTTAGRTSPLALVRADAQIVHQVPEGKLVDFYQQAGQYYAGARVIARTARATLRIQNLSRVPYTLRDARTGALLFHSAMSDAEVLDHPLGKERMVMLVVPGRVDLMRLEGCAPYLAATAEDWFDPTVR